MNNNVALSNVVPTTMGGVMALLSHVNACSAGQVTVGDEKRAYSVELWPDNLIDDSIKTKRGKPLSMPFAFWILRNVETALRKLDKAGVCEDADEPVEAELSPRKESRWASSS